MYRKVIVASIITAFVITGVTLYVLNVLQTAKDPVTYEELLSMEKEELISLILTHQSTSGGLGRVLFPLSILLASILTGILTAEIYRRVSIKREDVDYVLPPDERKVLKILAEHNGEMKQAELVALSGMNKVRVHRILKDLELRGILKRVKVGKTNIVVLHERAKKVFLT